MIVRQIAHPAAVPVLIDDHIHSGIERPVDYLMHALHIVRIDCICDVVRHHV